MIRLRWSDMWGRFIDFVCWLTACQRTVGHGAGRMGWIGSWHGVMAMAAPGMTAQQPSQGQPATVNGSMQLHCFQSIVGATGQIAALTGYQGREAKAIDMDGAAQQ